MDQEQQRLIQAHLSREVEGPVYSWPEVQESYGHAYSCGCEYVQNSEDSDEPDGGRWTKVCLGARLLSDKTLP